VTGESVSLPKQKMTKEEAKAIVEGHPKLKQIQAVFDEAQINGLTVNRNQVENILGNDDPKFRQAFETLYKNELEKMYAANESVASVAKDKGVSPDQLRKIRQQQTITDIEASAKYSG
jgi:alpha-glucosidase (family GH31 glycosyl hydrolase)